MKTNSNQTIELINKRGKVVGHTYPKRAKGLIKSGKAVYVNDNQICLTNKNKNLNYNFKEEIPNAILNCLSAVMSIVALVLCAIYSDDICNILSSILYGSFSLLFYTITTLYYSFKIGKTKNVFYVLSSSFTFLLIEGLSIPYLFSNLGSLNWSLFGICTLFNILGITLTSINKDKFKIFRIISYIINIVILIILSLNDVFGIIGIITFISGLYLYFMRGYKSIIGNSLLFVSSILYFFSIFFYVI